MPYRDVSESLRAYRDRVANDLHEAKEAAEEAATRAHRVRSLESELAETEALLAKLGHSTRKLPLLDGIAIAAPCKANWDEMVGDDRVRFCGQCEKNVYNLSSLPRDEAEALLAAREGNMCVRLYKRADGTVLTSDCPVGVTRRRRRRAVAGVVGGGLMAAAASMALASARTTMGSPIAGPVAMGSVAPLMGEPIAPTGDPTTTATATADVPVMGTVPVMGRMVRPPAQQKATMGQVRTK